MATFEIEQVDTWHDLHLRIDEYFTHYDNYIFRGQADTSWALESTLTRAIRKHYPGVQDVDAVVLKHLRAFKENIRGRCALDLDTVSDDALWSLGQHFGLLTPLLDWTRSAYVALFFSLIGECKSGRRALWALVESDISDLMPVSSTASGLRVVRPLSHANPRLVSQNGVLLAAPVGTSVDALVNPAKPTAWVTMYKIEFPDVIAHDALLALNNMNINHASLFPDLAGSSLYTNFQLEIEQHLEAGKQHGFRVCP